MSTSNGWFSKILSKDFWEIDNNDQNILGGNLPPEKLYATPRKINWDKLSLIKKMAGMNEKEIILMKEIDYLKSVQQHDLAQKVKYISKKESPTIGYDILSYFPDGTKKYIQVKNMMASSGLYLNLSNNELDFIKNNKHNTYIYKVFGVNNDPYLQSYFASDILENNIIVPTQFTVLLDR